MSYILDPVLFEGDTVDAVFLDDNEFMGQLMGTYDDSQLDTGIISDDEDYGVIIPDDVCGDSLEALDIEADEEISAYNSIGFTDVDDELIDKVLGI